MSFFYKPLTLKFCLGATLFFAVLYGGSSILPREFPGIDVRIRAIGYFDLLFSAYALVFLGATLSFLVADSSQVEALPPPPRWARFAGLLYFAVMAILIVLGPVTGWAGPWLVSSSLFRILLGFFLAVSIPLTTFACAAAGRPSATLWDKVCWYVNALWLALVFFAVGCVIRF